MKFMIFENASNFRVSINKQSGEFQDSMNDKNEITKILKTVSISTDDVKRVRKYAEEIMTNFKMIEVKATVINLNNRPAFVAFSKCENHAVVVCFEKKWKKYHANISSVYYPHAERALSGNMIEWTEKVNFAQDAKITNVYKELEAKIKELEDNAKKDSKKIAELEKRDGAFVKNLRGEKLSFEEEIIIAMTTVSEVGASEKETIAVSNESTVFSVTETAENLNDDLIVSIDQSNKENNMNVNMTIENYEQHEEYIQEIIKLNHENTTLKASRKSLLKDLFAEIEKTSKLELELKKIKLIQELNGK